jgi:hypothetical protein
MTLRAQGILLVFVLALVSAAGFILALVPGSRPSRNARSREFQQVVGGLGFGPSTSLSHCPFAFDPRLGSRCAQDNGPVPGGGCFCPHHACSIFFYPPLPSNPEEESE